MPSLNDVWEWIVSGIIQNAVWVVLAIWFVQFWQRTYLERKFGNWKVVLMRRGKLVLTRHVPAQKARDILSDPSEKSVYLKGILSPYVQLNCDLVEEGPKRKLLVEDHDARVITINLDKNPRKRGAVTR